MLNSVSVGLVLEVVVLNLSVSKSKIREITHKGWEMPLVNMMIVSKYGGGRWKCGKERGSVEV